MSMLFCLNCSFHLESEAANEEPTPPTSPSLAASRFQATSYFIYICMYVYISQGIVLRSSLESVP